LIEVFWLRFNFITKTFRLKLHSCLL